MRFVKVEKKGGTGIVLYGRDENGRHKFEIEDFEPYFFTPVEEARRRKQKDSRIVGIDVNGYETIQGQPVAKVFTSTSQVVPNVAEEFVKSFERDVLYTKRFRLDTGIVDGFEVPDGTRKNVGWREVKPTDGDSIPLRLAFLDIETRGLPQGKDFDKGTVDVLSIALYDSEKEKFYTLVWGPGCEEKIEESAFLSEWRSEFLPNEIHWFTSEEAMLKGFARLFNEIDADLVGGWNSEGFDLPYLFNRMEHIGLDPNTFSPQGRTVCWDEHGETRCKIKGRIVFDYLSAYAKLSSREAGSRKLQDVATEVLGVGKLGDLGGEVARLWKENPEKLVEYNVTDVDLVVGIDQSSESPRKFVEDLVSFTRCNWRDFYWNSVLVDSFLLSRRSEHQILPTKTTHEKPKKFKGGFVKTPSQSGTIKNVWFLDLRRMYPSIILSANMSPETLILGEPEDENFVEIPLEYVSEENEASSTAKFRVDKKGFLPEMIEEAFELRDAVDKELDETEPGTPEHTAALQRKAAVKRVINSFFGVLGFYKSRLFSPAIPTATTALGRRVIEVTIKVAEDGGYVVIYGDTDSIAVQIDSEEKARELEREINRRYDEFAKEMGMPHHRLEIELEKRYDVIYFKPGTKKRYCGLIGWADGSPVDGKPVERLSVTGFEYKRTDSSPITKKVQESLFIKALTEDTSNLVEYICDVAKRFRRGELSLKEIAFPSGIRKPLEEYKVASIHVKAARNANKHLGTNYGAGDKVRYVYLESTPPGVPSFDVIALDRDGKLPERYKVDYRKMFDKTVAKKAEPVLSALGIEGWRSEAENELNGQASMGDFV